MTRSLPALALCVPALAQNPPYTASGSQPREYLGLGLAAHADIDGDGIRENLALRGRGAVLLRGSDGAVLREHPRAQLALGDLDGDGWSELAAAGPDSEADLSLAVSVDVISGSSGAVLANWNWNPQGSAPSARRRAWPVRLGDIDGDGVGDVLAQESWGGVGLWTPPAALVLSGVDGAELRRHSGPIAALPMGDVNGDGRADYFLDQSVSAASEPPRLISGVSGAALAVHSPTPADAEPQVLSDLDGDGVPEIVRESLGPAFRIHSGASGALLHVVQGRPAHSLQYGPPEVLSADVDGDGVREIGVYELLTSTTTLRSLASGAVIARYDVLGFSVLNAGDVDGDGWSELAAAGPDSEAYLGFAESIDVLSGFSGAVLANWSWNPHGLAPVARRRLGMFGLGDVNGDGVGDLLAFEGHGGAGVVTPPAVLVLSGSDGSELRRHASAWTALPMGDVDGDGRPDYLLDPWPPNPSMQAQMISGASGGVLFVHTPPPPGTAVGYSAMPTSDLDGDGVPELVRGAFTSEFHVLSGSNGSLLRVVQGWPAHAQSSQGATEVLAADVNGDGVLEIGAYENLTSTTQLLSISSGALVARYDVLGLACLNAGDVDGDGRDDLLFGSPDSAEARGRVLLARAPHDARVGVGFAYGSGACPCGPGTSSEAGCAGEIATGAALTAWGSVSLTARDLQLRADGWRNLWAPTRGTEFLLYSPNALPAPLPNGAGLLALAPPRSRVASLLEDRWYWTIDAPELGAWNSFNAGQVGYFQLWRREFPAWNSTCQRPHNFSNAVAITFAP